MTAFSPFAAALEGVRVIRREPMAVLSWVCLWLAIPIIAGVLLAFFAPHAALPGGGGIRALTRQSGWAVSLLFTIFICLWIMTTASVYRAVLRSDEHGWHLFKLGPDEARVAAITTFSTIIALPLGSATAYLVYLMTQPVLLLAPGFPQWLVEGGALATVALEGWIAVRVSLSTVYTFDTHRYHLVSYWDITQTHFWRLLLVYLLVGLQIVFILLFDLVATGLLHMSMVGRLEPVAMIISGLLKLVEFVLIWVIFCASQAAAYKAIMLNPPPAFHPAPPGRVAS